MKKQNTIFTFNFYLFTLYSPPALWAASGSTAQYDIRITQYEIRSIKNNKLCETKPISKTPKMVVTLAIAMTNNNKQRTTNYSKQTQSNPICSELVEPISEDRRTLIRDAFLRMIISVDYDIPLAQVAAVAKIALLSCTQIHCYCMLDL
jgi:hypothetical protein